MPNILASGKKPLGNKKELCLQLTQPIDSGEGWQQYQTTVAEIEKLAGFKLTK
jgi:hypothetical protein